MEIEDVPLHYRENARSVHTQLRILDPDSDRMNEILFDNLTTPMAVIHEFDLKIVEETIGRVSLGPTPEGMDADPTTEEGLLTLTDSSETGVPPILHHWREYASGSLDETLIIICHGDPDLIDKL